MPRATAYAFQYSLPRVDGTSIKGHNVSMTLNRSKRARNGMRQKCYLTVACLGILFTGVSTPHAAETEVEVAGYEGNTTGSWACGSRAAVRYGGLAAKVRHSEREATPQQGVGATVAAAAAFEYAGATIHSASDTIAPEWERRFSRPFGAGNLRTGYHFHYVGVEVGAAFWSGWNTAQEAALAGLPELVLSLGPRDFLYGEIGLGVPTLTWLTRPAVPYLTLGVVPSERLKLEFHAGAFRAGPGLLEDFSLLFDGAWYMTLHKNWDLRASLAFGTELTDRQASVGFVYRLK